jgi:hypothetical protein
VTVAGSDAGPEGNALHTSHSDKEQQMSTEKRDLPEEDLTTGPTPDSRRADGEPDREHDTSDGPTPETREADEVTDRR